MPNRLEIRSEILEPRQDSVRRKYLSDLSNYTKRDCILYATAFNAKKLTVNPIPDSFVSITNEDIQGFMSALNGLTNRRLDIIIHSPGGTAEAAEQIVTYLRSKFDHIRAIIPQNAMSAATMLACACDEIVMAKHSAIGPIDPQMGVAGNNGWYFIPAQSILDEFEQAKSEVINNPELATLWVNRINQYPHGFFRKCQELIELSESMVGDWLHKYMFASAKNNKSKKIAEWLAKAGIHKSHGRPLGFDLVKSKGLKVIRLEDDQDLQELVLSIFHSTMITFDTTHCVKLIENQNGAGWFSLMEGK